MAGGSGVVPLMAMLRARADGRVGAPPFRLVYSVRDPDESSTRDELEARAATAGVGVRLVHTRRAPDGDARPVGRLRADDLVAAGWTAEDAPDLLRLRPDRLRRGRGRPARRARPRARPRSGQSDSGRAAREEATTMTGIDERDGAQAGTARTALGPPGTATSWPARSPSSSPSTSRRRWSAAAAAARAAEVATLRVYGPEPGLVGRCPGCDDVLLRVVRTPDAVWLDLGGVTSLRVPTPSATTSAHPDESGVCRRARGGIRPLSSSVRSVLQAGLDGGDDARPHARAASMTASTEPTATARWMLCTPSNSDATSTELLGAHRRAQLGELGGEPRPLDPGGRGQPASSSADPRVGRRAGVDVAGEDDGRRRGAADAPRRTTPRPRAPSCAG